LIKVSYEYYRIVVEILLRFYNLKRFKKTRGLSMFKKWGNNMESVDDNSNAKTEDFKKDFAKDVTYKITDEKISNKKNTILKGCKLTGDITIDCDLELNGDVKGNITSEKKSNIVIKGTCNGNIETKEGSVDIKGEMKRGNITAGGNVTISGKYRGGDVKANGKIVVNGEFNGKLEGNDIEIGPNARGKGELLFRESISIAKGAKVEVQIKQVQRELSITKITHEKEATNIKPLLNDVIGVK
jgi:cytoskeletal protein CcmA (bactofilin family)